MLTVESYKCPNPPRFEGGRWKETGLRYPDDKLETLKQAIIRRVSKSHIAHRIMNDVDERLFVAKWGTDHRLWHSDMKK